MTARPEQFPRAIREAPPTDLRAEIIRLGPWHLDIEVAPGLTTAAFLEAPSEAYPASYGEISFIDDREPFTSMLTSVYPGGLDGRSVLDCACNCGGYCFWSKELGAGKCFGFDVRQHWIDQANFLARHRQGPSDEVTFALSDLYQLPDRDLDPFDVTIFKGLFYHLPDPVSGLKIAADLTSELLIVNTATASGYPDGALVSSSESTTFLMSGVHGLNWFPTGPGVVTRILEWLGFPEVRCNWWRALSTPGLGRMELLAARDAKTFESFDSIEKDDVSAIRDTVATTVPPGSNVLVASKGDDELLRIEDRQGWHFPRNPDGSYTGYYPADGLAAIGHLEEQRAMGAGFLVFPSTAFWWLEHYPELRDHLQTRYSLLFQDEDVCMVFALEPPPGARTGDGSGDGR